MIHFLMGRGWRNLYHSNMFNFNVLFYFLNVRKIFWNFTHDLEEYLYTYKKRDDFGIMAGKT